MRSRFPAFLMFSWYLAAQPGHRPLSIYVLDFQTNLKGASASLAVDLATAVETAFLAQRDTFRVLERRNLSDLIRQRKLEKDLQALIRGGGVSPPLRSELKDADGFIRGELLERDDGVVLTVSLILLNSEKAWQEGRTHTRYEWLSTEFQRKEARELSAQAAAALRPAEPELPPRNEGPRGLALAQAGRCIEAVGLLESAADVDTGNAELYFWMGRCQNEARDFASAARSLTKAISRNQRRSDLYTERSRSFAGQEMIERALEDLDRALALDASNLAAVELRGDLFMRSGNYDDALAAYNHAYQAGPTVARCRKLADAFKKSGAASAAAKLETACRQVP